MNASSYPDSGVAEVMEAVPAPLAEESAPKSVISCRGLTQSYRIGKQTVPVLRGLDVELAPGEAVFLTGASGAGKTTLMYCLAGLEKPTAGEVLVGEKSFYRLSANAQARLRNQSMGYIFQNYYLLPELTAVENVLAPARIGGRKLRPRALELLERLGLAHRMNHLPGELSGGEQQRVAIARALINSPRIVFADEPTGNLDSHTGEEVIRLLLDLVKERGHSLLLVTHDQRLAQRGDRRLHLVDGQLTPPEEVGGM